MLQNKMLHADIQLSPRRANGSAARGGILHAVYEAQNAHTRKKVNG